jgi:hypothetical protein
MYKLFVCAVLCSAFGLFTSNSIAQDETDFHVVHVQTFKMSGFLGDDADAFNEMLVRQAGIINGDARVLRSYVLRHWWGDDSRDLVLVSEFAKGDDLFTFYEDLGGIFEKALSKEQLDADDALLAKYGGYHSDEIYRVVTNTTK